VIVTGGHRPGRAARVGASVPLAIAALAAAGLYGTVAAGLVSQWFTEANSSHGILLAIAAAFVLRRRWRLLRTAATRPANSGFLVLALALLVYVAGTLTGDIFILRVSLPIAVAGCLLALRGWGTMRPALAPLGLMVLAIPLPMVIVTSLTLPLQLVASQVAAEVLNASGVFVAREGNLLILRDMTLEVAEACSGLRSLVSLVTVGAICGAVLSLSFPRAMLLMACAVPVAVVGNGFRVAATGFLVTWFGEIAVSEVAHEVTGFVAFLVMSAAIIAIQIAANRWTKRASRAGAGRAVAVSDSVLAVSR
jgi:exosortase